MDSQVGAILRRARNRRKIELSEVETATRIRLRYLRAIEAEEWDVLPGGVYTRGFIRTYASFLGLDGERLAEDYRASVEGETADQATGSTPALPRPAEPAPPHRPRLAWLAATTAVVAVVAVAVALLPGGGGSEGGSPLGPGRSSRENATKPGSRKGHSLAPASVSMQLAANAEVWVCLLDARGRPLVDGQILEAGAEVGPFRSGSFTVSFGNGEVSMMVDGSEAEIPATSSPVGYSIDRAGNLSELGETERPTCT